MAPATTDRRKSVYSETGKKPKANISDELYRVPFKYGWTREVVTPSPLTNSSNHIFYTSPSGKKCRKISEIIPMLQGELTKEHFIFGTHILGAEAQYETVRQALSREDHLAALKERRKSTASDKTKAKQKRRQTIGAESHSKPQAEAGTAAFGKRLKSIDDFLSMADESMTLLALKPVKPLALEAIKPLAAKVVEAPVMGKRVPKPKLPKGATSVPEGWTATMAVKGNARLLAAAINGNARAAASSTVTASSCAAPVRQETRETCGFCLKLIEGSVCQSCVQSAESVDAVPLMAAYGELQDGEGESEKSYQAGTVSNGLDDIKVLEPPGEMPPAELLSTDTTPASTPINLYTHQEVVVISGQKAISAVAEPAMTSQQKVLVPNPPDLTSYYEVYDKRIAAPKQSSPPDNPWEQMFGSGFNCRFLTSLMQTLNQQDRANCSEVSKLWHLCSRDAEVWKSVSLRGTKVNNWPALVREMARNGTRELDMMGAIIPTSGTLVAGDMRVLTDMRSVRTDHTKADFLHQIFRSLPQLEKLMCTCVSSCLNMTDIDKIENLYELRVRMTDTKGIDHRGLAQAGGVRRLELVNVDLDGNFSDLLAQCPTVEELLLIPKCQTNSALMMRAVMDISKNGNQLKLFKLVLVTQLLTATSALVGNPDVPMVPVVRPVPGIPLNDPLNICSDECHQQGHSMCVAVLPFERLKAIMAEMMPYSSLSVVTTAMMDTPSIQLERLPPDAAVPKPTLILNF
ncbi:GL20679 [Drosophila persimilis]|uniref:GL20679 n=1 Tax=Drosophila persimilis TaxID=7234 RepID=B4IQX4_DROPE|nr:GL20679 [Drosophila persimilis]